MRVLKSIALVLFLCACDSTPQGSPLLADISSYLSPAQVKAMVKPDTNNWTEIEHSKTASSDRRPPYELLGISVKQYVDLGEVGEARFFFFNNRLMRVEFYASNLERYQTKIANHRKVKFTKKLWEYSNNAYQEAFLAPHTRLLLIPKGYFVFEDKILTKEHGEWILKYS